MALQYVSEDRGRSVVMAYRLADSRPERALVLRGLDPAAWYKVTVDGKVQRPAPAQQLAGQGLQVRLDAEWRAAVIELEIEKQ